jgi:hypothetical protein
MKEDYSPYHSEICRLLQQDADDSRKLADELFETFLKRAKRLKQRREHSGQLLSEDWLEEEEFLCDELVRLNRQRRTVREAKAALADAITREGETRIAEEKAKREAEEEQLDEQKRLNILASDYVYGNA